MFIKSGSRTRRRVTLQKPSLVFALRVDTKSAPGGFVFCAASHKDVANAENAGAQSPKSK